MEAETVRSAPSKEPEPPPEQDPEPPRSLFQRFRFLLVLALFAGAYGVVYAFDLQEYFTRERIESMMEEAGVWGFLLFLAVFAVGELLHIPGIIFVAAAMVVYDRLWGSAASFAGALVSVTVSFFIVRAIGGKALARIKRPRIRKILDRLEDRPIATVAILRLILWMAPPLNYALAMSNIRFREYFIGSALGLFIPVVAVALFFDWVLTNLL